MPLLLSLCVVIGILIGTFFARHFSTNRLNIINSGSNRLNNLLQIIEDQYVDKVDLDSLMEKAIPQILSDLDPHSVYISAKDVQTERRSHASLERPERYKSKDRHHALRRKRRETVYRYSW